MPELNLNVLLLVAAVAVVIFWPKIAALVQDKDHNGIPDMDIGAALRTPAKSECADKLLAAAQCMTEPEQAAEKEVLVKAAVKKIMEQK